MRRIVALLWLLTALTKVSIAQTDSSGLRISLLTCSPGSELYSTFGHSALRIVDSAVGTDIVYNFGVFDFSDPDFYAKFVRGKLLYFLDQEAFPYFQYAYVVEGRRITEQVLRLDAARKRSIQAFLAENLRPENRFYKYDFLFDNCTTRLRDLILGQQSSYIRTGRVLDDTTATFRAQLHSYLDRNRQYWSALGIDILLGSRIDRPANCGCVGASASRCASVRRVFDVVIGHGAPRAPGRTRGARRGPASPRAASSGSVPGAGASP